MDTQDLKMILGLLERVTIQGNEALPFVQLQQRISQEIQKREAPTTKTNNEVPQK